jgi:sugar phosphate isomerase/epimerase
MEGPPLHLGLSSYALPWSVGVPGYDPGAQRIDAAALIDLAAHWGLGVVQIADNLPLAKLDGEERRRLAQHAKGARVQVEIGVRGLDPETIHMGLALCADFHSPLLRTIADGPTLQGTEERVTPLLPALEQAGVTLAVENHGVHRAREIRDWLKNIAHPLVGACIDTVNSLQLGESVEEVVAVLAPYTVNVHLKDFVVSRVPHKLGLTVSGAKPGTGLVNVDHLLSTLSSYGYTGSIILEQWPPLGASMADTTVTERAWLCEGIETLRRRYPSLT